MLAAALALVDEHGIDALSMRRLAAELGVEAMSLYNHVANKGDLVDAIVDLVLAEIELSDAPAWEVAIRHCAVSAHEAFLRHPWACSLVIAPTATRGARTPRLRYIEWLLRRLREAGFSPQLAYHGYHTLDAHIVGFTLWQLGHYAAARNLSGDRSLDELAAEFLRTLRADEYRYLAEHVEQHLAAPEGGSAREFEFGLDLILDGLARLRDGG